MWGLSPGVTAEHMLGTLQLATGDTPRHPGTRLLSPHLHASL